MSDNWVVQNLEKALNVWNDKLSEIWQLITQSPTNFKGGTLWNVVSSIHGALQAIGYALLVLFFVAFALLRMLVSLLVTVLGLVNKLPVIGAVNHGLGWSVGALASLVDIYLVLCVVWALIVITGGNLTMLNDTVMSTSLYYKVFNLFNPFL